MKKVIVVGAVIQNEKNEILCALRSSTMSMANYWEFPGGKLEAGESFESALKREIQEELGCAIEVQAKIMDVNHHYEHIIVNLHTFWAAIIAGEPKAREHAELQWTPMGELAKLNWTPADIPTIKKILQKLP